MSKATQAVASASMLLQSGDADGACNRAYYAMFDAARAALAAAGCDTGRTHRSVLNMFHEAWIKHGPLPSQTGRLLKRAEAFRYVADYSGDEVQLADAQQMVEECRVFVNTIARLLGARP